VDKVQDAHCKFDAIERFRIAPLEASLLIDDLQLGRHAEVQASHARDLEQACRIELAPDDELASRKKAARAFSRKRLVTLREQPCRRGHIDIAPPGGPLHRKG
jgi:hypothetical protein